LNKAILNIFKKQFAVSLSYIAVFRVRTLEGIIFNKPFKIDTLRLLKKNIIKDKLYNKVKRRL
ncbi:hypothetical protein B0T20DRAFT_349052, partial [Sordaria brevicollis]